MVDQVLVVQLFKMAPHFLGRVVNTFGIMFSDPVVFLPAFSPPSSSIFAVALVSWAMVVSLFPRFLLFLNFLIIDDDYYGCLLISNIG